MRRASTSFPTPDSPVIRIEEALPAILGIAAASWRACDEMPSDLLEEVSRMLLCFSAWVRTISTNWLTSKGLVT